MYYPNIRPIVRGKAGKPIEFGAKFSVLLVEGYSFIHRLRWDAFNEGRDLKVQVEAYYARFAFYPASMPGDKIFRNCVNRRYLKESGIRFC